MPSPFESFNAKNLTPGQVAQTFIPPRKHFARLCQRSHSVILGPRGSGKTTLLKMLQLGALSQWKHPDASYFIQKLDYVSVFVASDMVWKAQVDNLFGFSIPAHVTRRLGLATFTTQVLMSLIGTMESLSVPSLQGHASLKRFYIDLSQETEANLARALSSQWHLKPGISSLLGIRLALRGRLADIALLAEQLDGMEDNAASELTRTKAELYLPFFENTLWAIDLFNSLTGRPDQRWALLFDELEIAPDSVRHQLLTRLRGADQTVLLKLSMSPYNRDFRALHGESGAKPGNDYEPIALWYSEKEDAVPFATELLASMLADQNVPIANPSAIFGFSEFDVGREEQRSLGSAYRPGSSNYRKFVDLSSRDKSFSDYITRMGIDLRRMHELADDQRAGQLRKLTSIVTVRDAYLREGVQLSGQKSSLRSRKRPHLYTGASSLFAVTEGNPRWIIGTLGPLINVYSAKGGSATVGKSLQSRAILNSSERFRALLSTVPVEHDGSQGSLLAVIDAIGRYFHNGVVLAPFRPEPPTSFIVDVETPPAIVHALQVAINVGAIVSASDMPGEDSGETIVGNRFRLTYLLAPYYRLPLTMGKARQLSKILSLVDSDLSTSDLFET